MDVVSMPKVETVMTTSTTVNRIVISEHTKDASVRSVPFFANTRSSNFRTRRISHAPTMYITSAASTFRPN